MNRSHLQTGVLMSSFVSAWLCAQPIAAQVISDTTLPEGARSQVSGNPDFQIDGGARRGGNLFHSFQSFSVPTGGSASFNNAADVRNIFSRVTGGSISNIDGVIRANGTANLFLLNPNGILFGPNASLNIGGSFVASTASSIDFADNFRYSAANPQTTSLLTVSVPVGLQMGANSGQIGVQGNGYDLSVSVPIFSPGVRGDSAAGLRVPLGQTLALIGGDINIDGGTLTAEQGRIELGSVRSGRVSLRNGFALSYSRMQTFGNVRLSQQALADASGGGSIQVQGNQVLLIDGSVMLIQNQGTQGGGSINVNAAQSFKMSGSSPNGAFLGGLNSENVGVRRGANIIVSTQQFIGERGAGLIARSYSSGNVGNITVNASDFIRLIGSSPTNPILTSSISNNLLSSGSGGTITISTGRLSLLEGGTIASVVFGTGKGGTVTVDASGSIEIIGQTSILSQSSVIAITLGVGDAGRVTVNTSRLAIRDGGALSTSTAGFGNAGSVTINARELVEVSGRPRAPALSSYLGSPAPVVAESIRQAFGLPDIPSGNSGSVTISTPRLRVTDGANVTVNNEGTGSAGTLRVNANSIVLDRDSSITAATASGEGGNLDLNVQDFLLLRNSGQITTSAGGNGNGGNIRIDAGTIVAIPTENSDIRANSVNARGGNISIDASGIFGIQPRSQDTPLSDITATGATADLSGAIDVTTVDTDLTAGLFPLPTDLVDSSQLIARGCPADQGNSFVISGRGGLPPSPEQQLDDDAHWQDRRRLMVPQQQTDSGSEGRVQDLSATPVSPILEATGWQMTPAKEVILVAALSNPTVQNPLHQPIACNGRR